RGLQPPNEKFGTVRIGFRDVTDEYLAGFFARDEQPGWLGRSTASCGGDTDAVDAMLDALDDGGPAETEALTEGEMAAVEAIEPEAAPAPAPDPDRSPKKIHALMRNDRITRAAKDRAKQKREAEEIDLRVVLVIVVATDELVGVEDVALEAIAERAAQDRQRNERGRADPIVVFRGLGIALKVQRLEHPPDIRAPDAGGGVVGAVGKNNNVGAGHSKGLAEKERDRAHERSRRE